MRRALRTSLITLVSGLTAVSAGLPAPATSADAAPDRPVRTAARSATFGGATTSYVETDRWITGDAPDAIAVDDRGRVLVAVSDKVLIYNRAGRLRGSFVTDATAYGLATGPGGEIYVSDYGSFPGEVRVYSSAGVYQGSYVGDESSSPWGLEVRPSTGQLWIADVTGDMIERANPGAPSLGGHGTGNGQFDGPTDIAHGNGSMYVVDGGNYRIQRLNAGTGAFQTKWGQSGFGRGQFRLPISVDTGVGGSVLVLDKFSSGDSELEVFKPGGGYLATTKVPASHPFALATDKAGNVYVTGLLSYPRGGWGVVKLSPTGTGKARLTARRVDADASRKKAAVRLACARSRACTGAVKVVHRGRTVATGRFALKAGKRAAVKIRVTAKGRKLLRKRARTAVQIRLTTGTGTKKVKGTFTR